MARVYLIAAQSCLRWGKPLAARAMLCRALGECNRGEHAAVKGHVMRALSALRAVA